MNHSANVIKPSLKKQLHQPHQNRKSQKTNTESRRYSIRKDKMNEQLPLHQNL